jgi:hypothetical protein
LLGWRAAALAFSAATIGIIVWIQSATRPFEQPGLRPSVLSVKGGTLSLQLVRERANAWSDRELGFRPGDRFKLLVTSPAALGPDWSVVVYQNQTAYFPLSLPKQPIHGNLVPLPGAIALDGNTPAEVCVAFGSSDELTQQRLAQGAKMLPDNSVCVQVLPE